VKHGIVSLGLGLALALFTGLAAGQASFTKVKLKTGYVVEGTILDELPGGGLKMALVTGGTRVIAGADIASIERPGAAPTAPPVVPAPAAPAPPPAPEPSPPPVATVPPDAGPRGGPGESCQARIDCADGLGCFKHVCRAAEVATEASAASFRPEDPEPGDAEAKAERHDGYYDGVYGGGLVGGAVAPAFPGVAGIGGATGFVGWRRGLFDLRVGLGGFGAAFPNGSMGVAVVRPETLFWVAGPYGFGVSLGPCVGHYEDFYISGSLLYGGLASATPVALRFEAGSAFLEPSLSAGAIFGSVGDSPDIFARPAVLLALAVYSQ